MPRGMDYDAMTAELESQSEAEAKAAEAAKQKLQKQALIKKWQDKVARARKHDQSAREQWADDRRVARNDPPEGQTPWLVDTNLIGAIMEVLAAFLYAINPDVSVRPSPTWSFISCVQPRSAESGVPSW